MLQETGFLLLAISGYLFNILAMHTLFEDKPVMLTLVKVGIIAFIGLSLVNLYYSIKVNRQLLNKTSEK